MVSLLGRDSFMFCEMLYHKYCIWMIFLCNESSDVFSKKINTEAFTTNVTFKGVIYQVNFHMLIQCRFQFESHVANVTSKYVYSIMDFLMFCQDSFITKCLPTSLTVVRLFSFYEMSLFMILKLMLLSTRFITNVTFER